MTTFAPAAADPAPSMTVLQRKLEKMREKAAEHCMMEGYDVAAALKKAREDPETRQVYLHTPLTVSVGMAMNTGGKRTNTAAADNDRKDNDRKKPRKYEDEGGDSGAQGSGGGGRGAGRGKGKGKGKGGGGGRGAGGGGNTPRSQLKTKTPDGQLICFAFNNKKCKGNCGKVHVCQKCLSPKHGFKKCEN